MSNTFPIPNLTEFVAGSTDANQPNLADLLKSLIRTGLKLNTAQPLPAQRSQSSLSDQVQYGNELASWLDQVADEQIKKFAHVESINHEQSLQLLARSQESEIDSLTGLANRRSFDRKLAQCSVSVQHSQCPLVLVIFDIDHFKLINDTRGHHVGDAVLRGLSTQLRRNLPENATLARIGGEEFALLLAGASYDQAVEIAESLRSLIEHTAFTFDGHRLAITISCGLAQLRPSEHSEQVLRRADMALYAAKQAGRNLTYGHDGSDTCEVSVYNSNGGLHVPPGYQVFDLNQTSSSKITGVEDQTNQPQTTLRTARANWCDSLMLCWYLRQRIAECFRNNDPLCVMAIEIDKVNSLTKNYGIAAYHFMLRAEMLHLDSNLRDSDVISRTCHSKVLVVFPRTALASLTSLLERLRTSMHNFVFPALSGFVDYTISLGVTQLQPGDCVQSIINRAESTLAAAQAHGEASFFASDVNRVWQLSDQETVQPVS